MSRELWIVGAILLVFVIWVAAKVRLYARKSEAQWEAVDKGNLRTREDAH